MRLITLDFETFYSSDFTLSKLTSESYVRDARFKVHMVGVKIDNGETQVLSPQQFMKMKGMFRFDTAMVLCHHAHFDGLILYHIYGIHPKLFLDTLSMARAIFPMAKSNSLKMLAERLGVGVKGSELENTRGKHTLTQDEYNRLAVYCKNDVDLTYDLFQKMKGELPPAEYQLIDLTVKMFTNPILRLNKEILGEEHTAEVRRKQELLDSCCSDRKVLASNPKFAALLESMGITPPKKLSPAALKKGEEKWTYAFGKSDEGFKALLESEDEAVRAVCEARMGVKSTINETRAARLMDISTRGPVPIYLAYYGAHTGRYSGGDKVNWQNMTRGSRLRLAVEAPDGYQIVVADLSQIEARVLAAFAGEEPLLDAFRRADVEEGDTDVYTDMASRVLQRPITKADKRERQLGKALVLGAGYGLGWKKFQEMQRVGMLGAPSNIFGVDMIDTLGVNLEFFQTKYMKDVHETMPAGATDVQKHLVHCACSKAIIDLYRSSNPAIVALWDDASRALAYCSDGAAFAFGVSPQIIVGKEFMLMPNGMKIKYPGLKGIKTRRGVEYTKEGKRFPERVYGGLVVENCLGGETEVLTLYGWRRIKDITIATPVWDGLNWVRHKGLICNGAQSVIDFGGVKITPEHRVYTTHWVEAQYAVPREATSSFQGSYQLPKRIVDGTRLLRGQRRENSLAGKMRLWCGENITLFGNYTAQKTILRMPKKKTGSGSLADTRDVTSSGLRSMAEYVGSLQSPLAQSIQKLWWSGYRSLRTVAKYSQRWVCSVLAGYGGYLSAQFGFGSYQQRGRIYTTELSLGSKEGELSEYAEKSGDRYPFRQDASLRGSGYIRGKDQHSTIPAGVGVGNKVPIRQTRLPQQTVVYDLLDCGPNHRFTVRGADKKPFLVHNCTQALARIIMTDAMLKINKKYRVVLTVHDEILCCVPDEEAQECFDYMVECLTIAPKWCPDIPLNAAGGFAKNYSK